MQCPACKKPGLQARRDQQTALEVDTCLECQGIWFDVGELFRLTQMSKNEGFAQDCQVTEEIREGLKTRSGPASLLQESLLMLYGLLRSFLGQPLR